MIANETTNKPVPVVCPACVKKRAKPAGTLWRVDLSRLEEGLGHEGYRCTKCNHTIKYVAKGRSA